MSLRPGDAVEHFVIVSSLGEGGMGQVYLARDTRLQRSIALKIMQPEAEGEGSAQSASNGAARLLREAQSAAGLEHPNVVTIYEVGEIKGEGEEAGRPFIAMELVKGKALRAFVGDESVKMKERVRWLTDTARALAAAHRAGLIHRDIKPENVMIRDDGVVKVLDFGLAKRAASGAASLSSSTEAQVLPSLTGKGIAIGTPYYMAPEQMRREPLDGRADQFAWGVVAYELLSGTPPWGREVDALELVSKLLSEDPTPLAEVRPDVPAHVAAAVTRAMSKRKAARFETMDALIATLEDESGAFLPTMPRIAVSEPSYPDAPVVPTARLRTTVSAPRSRAWGVRIAVGAAVVAASAFAIVTVSKRPSQKTPAPSASTAAASRECTRHTECVAKLGGKPAVCNVGGKCAAIESEDCKALFEPSDLGRDDVVWVGSMLPTTGAAAASYGAMNLTGADFARVEIARATGSIRGSKVRPVALVACDDAVDAARVANHLVDDVGVPAIVGFRSGQELVDLASSLLIPRGVAAVASLTSSPLITRIPQPEGESRLVWRTTYSVDAVAKATAALMHDALEPKVAETSRVAVARIDTPAGESFGETFYRHLVFNGRPALENGHAYQEITFDDQRAETEVARVANRLAAMEPTFIVLLGDGAVTSAVVESVEAKWKTGASRRPIYLVANDSTKILAAFVGTSVGRRRRVFAINSTSGSTSNARFVIRYNEAYPSQVTRTFNPGSTYDAFYMIAYASFALKAETVTGRALARAFKKLVPPGRPIEAGPTSVFDAITALGSGGSIDLQGTQSQLDFDLATGEAPTDFALLCPGVDPHGGVVEDVESGVVYRAASSAVEGTIHCP